MDALERARRQWTALGARDPLWAILSHPDRQNGRWDLSEFFETGAKEIEDVIAKAAAIAPISFGTAVDFGCGVGRLSQALASHFGSVVGIDIAKPMLEQAERLNRFPERCRYIHNAAADLSVLADESADLIYSNITLQHVTPRLQRTYIREFFRVARPGSHVIFQVPSRPRSVAWNAAKRALPVAVTNSIWRIRTGSPAAMESYFTPAGVVTKIVGEARGSVSQAELDHGGPPGWESRKYFCLKWT